MEQYEYLNGPPAPRMVAELAMRHDALVKQLADAQATIAALQARVQELEESRDAWKASQECSEKAYMALVNQIPAERFDYDPINVALLDGAKEQEIIGRKQIADLQSQLTQRTAELEAIEKILDIDSGKTTVEKVRDLHHSFKQVWESYQDASNEMFKAQAELERVRGELAETKEVEAALSSKVAEYEVELNGDPQNFYGRGRTVGLRTLVAALPKVEGEIRVEEGKVISVEPVRGADPPLWWRRTIATFEDGLLAKHYSKLLQHRQGMEG